MTVRTSPSSDGEHARKFCHTDTDWSCRWLHNCSVLHYIPTTTGPSTYITYESKYIQIFCPSDFLTDCRYLVLYHIPVCCLMTNIAQYPLTISGPALTVTKIFSNCLDQNWPFWLRWLWENSSQIFLNVSFIYILILISCSCAWRVQNKLHNFSTRYPLAHVRQYNI